MALDCTTDILVGSILFMPLSIAAMLLVGYGTFAFIEDQKIKKRQVSKCHKASMLLFFFWVGLDVFVGALGIWRFCPGAIPAAMGDFLMPTHSPLTWASVNAFFVILFYLRLLKIFDGTNYGLSKCTKAIWVFFFGLLLAFQYLGAVPFSYAYHVADEKSVLDILYLTAISSFLLTFGLNIAMVALFVSKLCSTIKLVAGAMAHTRRKGAKRDRIIGSISKLAVLSMISMSVSMLTYVIFIAAAEDDDRVDNELAKWAPLFVLTSYMHLIDVMTNFICIAFFFDRLKGFYGKICGRCDVCCSECVTCCVFGKKEYYAKGKDPEEAETTETTGMTGPTQSTNSAINSAIALGAPNSPKSVASESTADPSYAGDMGSVQLSVGSEVTLDKVQSVTITQTQSEEA